MLRRRGEGDLRDARIICLVIEGDWGVLIEGIERGVLIGCIDRWAERGELIGCIDRVMC